MRKLYLVPFLFAAVLSLASAGQAQKKVKLSINGNAVSTQTRTMAGQTWVPLADVAKALKMKTYTSGSQITLRPAGGALQIANKLKGVQGEELFSGKYRFIVLSTTRTPRYERRYKSTYVTDRPVEAAAGEELIVVSCQIKNGTPEKREFAFATGDWAENTSLTDQNEQSYQPQEYDVAADENAPLGRWALPGSAVNFAVIFRVPQGTAIKDLIYTVVEYKERGSKKGTDFRVTLKP